MQKSSRMDISRLAGFIIAFVSLRYRGTQGGQGLQMRLAILKSF